MADWGINTRVVPIRRIAVPLTSNNHAIQSEFPQATIISGCLFHYDESRLFIIYLLQKTPRVDYPETADIRKCNGQTGNGEPETAKRPRTPPPTPHPLQETQIELKRLPHAMAPWSRALALSTKRLTIDTLGYGSLKSQNVNRVIKKRLLLLSFRI